MAKFKLTDKQKEALDVLGGDAQHALLYGGSRSGKTLLILWAIVQRAMAAPKSRHAVLRYRFNHVKSSVVLDTFPKLMSLCYPKLDYDLDRSDWYATMPNDSQLWFGGLDDKERAEKILGQEYATLFLNECSQIPYNSRNTALTRLAQKVECVDGRLLRLRMWYDCNPPKRGHWTYQLFYAHRDPDSKKFVDPADYAAMQVNPSDNQANLPATYLKTLEQLPARLQERFLHGRFTDDTVGQLWTQEGIETWRELGTPPDMQRIVVSVDPSGSEDEDNAANDEIGIVAAGLGTDGNGYLIEDLTCKVGPATWGNIATQAYERHAADCVVGEANYGGAMVEHVIQTARKRTPYRKVTASRGKVVRAEPISALAEKGKIRHLGYFPDLEDELTSFTTSGYVGQNSPNRADAYVWAFTELFGGIVTGPRKPKQPAPHIAGGWMSL